MAPKTRFFRQLALVSYLSLLLWVLLWHFLLGADEGYSVLFITLMWVVPLLFPLPGLLKGKPYTHAWANFVLMFYLCTG